MGSKKTRWIAKSPKRGKKIGLTSAIGFRATWTVLILTAIVGLGYGSHQRLSAKARTAPPAAETMAPDPSSTTTKSPVTNTHDGTTPSAPEGTSAAAKPAKVPPTTIEGCLERNGESFRLKDTSGTDAPKSRSWKSGFLKKGASTVDVLDASDSLGLANRVGTRVSVTGTLVDKQMQAHAIHRVASSCS